MADEELTLILRLRDEATKQMKSARAGIVAAGAAIAAAGFAAGAKWDKATKTIIAGTGKTGDALKVLQGDYQAVAKFGDGAAKTVAALNTVFGETGPKLQKASAAVLKTSNAFGELDVAGLGESMKLFGRDITDVNSTLDTFTHVSQKSGAPLGALISQVRTFGPVFKNANISLDETIGFMGAMETAGVDITRVMPAINASLRRAAVGGVTDLRGHLGGLIESIRDTESGTDALKIATKAFGAEGAQRMTAAIRSGALPAMEEWNTMFGDSTDAVEKTHQAGRTWRDTLREMKDGALAYLGPGGDMVGAIGSAASGLALAGPQMLKWIKGIKFATIAQRAFNLAMRLNPIGLIVTAIALVGLAIYKWRDQIWGFLKGAWNGLISGLEKGYNFIARLVPGMDEVSFASKMSFEPAVEAAAEATVDLALEAETTSAALSGGGTSLVASLGDTAKAAEDAAEKIRLAALAVASSELNEFYDRQADFRAEALKTTQWLQQQHDDRGAAASAAASAELNEFRDRQADFQAEAAKTTAWLASKAEVDGTSSGNVWSTNFFDTIGRAFEGGGGFMGGIKSLATQGFKSIFGGGGGGGGGGGFLGGLFSGGGSSAASDFVGPQSPGAGGLLGGLMGKMNAAKGWLSKGIGTAMDMVPIIGPLLSAFGPAMLKGLGKLAGKVWGGIKKLFGGPDKAELAARETFAGFHKGVVKELGGTQRYADEVQRAVDDGWDRTLAETRAGFILWGTDAGKTYDEAFADYGRYEKAVRDGNTSLMKQIDAEYEQYRQGAKVAADTAIAESDRTTSAISDNIDSLGNQIGDDYAAMIASAAGAFEGMAEHAEGFATGAAGEMEVLHRSAAGAFDAIVLDSQRARDGVNAAFAGISGPRPRPSGGLPGRQHGGPVSAGVPYRVGERGEEIFVPGSSGSVVPNKSIPSADEIGAAVVAALHRVPLVVPRDAVTDAMLRNAPRRQALHGTA